MLLQHLYDQTHPQVTDSEADTTFSETPQHAPLSTHTGKFIFYDIIVTYNNYLVGMTHLGRLDLLAQYPGGRWEPGQNFKVIFI